ncbi:MAG TPA: formate dehydrogenase accessory protein FdhE [Bryobacteraceae bacterium]|nr:formate dehydrogenase accessory protein FdhE [Bryobacteraceae bacterium]
MKWTYDARIQRAAELIPDYPAAAELLAFYRQLALFQQSIFATLRSKGETDVCALAPYFNPLAELIARSGPQGMSGKACLSTELLQRAWEDDLKDPYARFSARVLLQPYAESLASRGDVPAQPESKVCPFCSAWPVAGVLRGEGDGAKRWLLCSLCGTEWPFRRVLCPGCGEEDKDKLPIYKAAGFDSVRVDACDTCHTYLKSVDLTTDGHAVPVVDEIASVALNIWAEEHGYSKLETNLLGM